MYKPIISILFFTLFCTNIGIGQNIKITPHDLKAELDSWTILGLAQDDNGYIWLADIQNGLFRYDGSNFKRYSSKGGSNLGPTSNRSECITTDGHYIWMGTFSNGLNMLDPETGLFTHYKHDPNDPNSIRSDHIRTLAYDQQGMLWIGTMTGVDKFDPETKTFTHIHTNDPDEVILQEEHIRAMYVDKEGTLWIGTSSPFPNEATVGGLFKMEVAKGSITHYQSSESENTLIDNRVRAIFEDSRGTFWVGTSGDGLHTMDRDKGTFTRHTFDIQHPKKLSRSPSRNLNTTTPDHITFINEDDGGNIWIGTFNGGLSMYDPEISEMTHYHQSNSIAHEKIEANAFWTSLKTKDQLLWITTWPDAVEDEILYQITAKSKQITSTPAEFSSNIRSLVSDGEGGFYYGGSDGIWHEDKTGDVKRIIRLEGFEGASAPGARELVLNNNQLWFPTVLGLYSVNLQNNELDIYDYDPSNPLSPSTNAINSIEYVGNDQLLLGTDDGIELFDIPLEKSQSIQMIDKAGVERSNNSVGDILKDSKNRIWLSVLFNGIRQLNLETGEMQNYRLQSDGENVIFIFEDSQGTIWIGAVGSGLYRLNEKTQEFEQFADLHHILDENCAPFTIAEDTNQNLWIGVIGGIAKLNVRSNQAKLYGSGWGINTFRILEKAALATGKGDIILGAQTGYYRFHPDDLQLEDDYSTFPFIDELYINDKGSENYNTRINTQDSRRDLLELTYNENSFSFTINHIDYFTNSGDQSLQYRLVGHDPNWRNVDSGERLSFYSIPPGNYNFEAKVLNLSGSWQEKNINILISHPWWNTWWAYILYGLGTLLLGFGVHTFQKDRTIRIERERTKDRELVHAKEIEKAYSELKSTQSQLIQSEKMASLGELTAGIAHEIQNPLNFVNNFSDVNTELIDELVESITSTRPAPKALADGRPLPRNEGDILISSEKLENIKELASDIKANEEKIKHHGSRADSIVKGMLQHSRTNAGEKVPTDINALADEFLRLSYHGLRAKDISFNATMETNFDDSIGKIKVIPQDIGRVFLNIINNAFYACSARNAGKGADRSVSTEELGARDAKGNDANAQPTDVSVSTKNLTPKENPTRVEYKPVVTLTTKQLNDSTIITISDNGIGMSKDTLEKVFQPFFTTKPTGSGTGLGMSISYDIITKGHGGEMTVESKEGEGTTFIITIPIAS